jgi:hypothetical protein
MATSFKLGATGDPTLWNNTANWTNGIPVTNEDVTDASNATDDIGTALAPLSLDKLNLSGTLDVIGALSLGTLTGPGGSIYSDSVLGNTPAALTIGYIDDEYIDELNEEAIQAAMDGGSTQPYEQQGTGDLTIGAEGANAITSVSGDPGESYFVESGGEVVMSSPSSFSTFTYDTGGGAFAFNQTNDTIGNSLNDLSAGDSIALPGDGKAATTSVVLGPIDPNGGVAIVSITSNLGTTTFSNVTYGASTPGGYTVSTDAATGLEKITVTPSNQFEPLVSEVVNGTAGYSWSNPANWSLFNLPVYEQQFTMVDDPSLSAPAIGFDDIPNLTLAGLNLSALLRVTGALTIGTLVFGAIDHSIRSDTEDTGNASATVTIDALSGSGEIGAYGAGALTTVQSPTDPGESYEVDGGGEVALTATPNAASTFQYGGGGGTFAFSDPGATVSSGLLGLSAGDSLVLPGTSVTSATFGAHSLTIVTDLGTNTFTFANVTYGAVTPTGYTAAVTTDAAGDGVLHITFVKALVTKLSLPSSQSSTGQIIGSGGELDIYGTANSPTVDAMAMLYVDKGGVANNAVIEDGGIEHIYGGNDMRATLMPDATQYVEYQTYDGGTATDTTIDAGALQDVETYTTATGAMVDGEQDVYGSVTGTMVMADGKLEAFAGNVTSATVGSGGLLDLRGGNDNDTTIMHGGVEHVFQNAHDNEPTIFGELDNDQLVTSAVVESGGRLIIESDGDSRFANDGSGGTDVVMEPALTITPVEGADAITAADFAAGGTIMVSGTAKGAEGQLVTLTASKAMEGSMPVALGTATVDSSGNWSVAVADTAFQTLVGTDTFEATLPDAVGHMVLATTSVTVAPPTEPVVTLAPIGAGNVLTTADFAAGSTIMIAGTAKGAEGELLTLGVLESSPATDSLGFLQLGTATVDAAGAWSVAVPNVALEALAGLYTLEAYVADAFGNTVSATDELTVDAPAKPVVTIAPVLGDNVVTADAFTAGPTIAITGTAIGAQGQVLTLGFAEEGQENAGVNFVVLGTATVDSSGDWSIAVPDASFQALVGTNTIVAYVADAFGNTVMATHELTVAPLLTAKTDIALTAGQEVMITGTIDLADLDDPINVTLVNVAGGKPLTGATTANVNGAWSFDAGTFRAGEYEVTASATDSSGLTTTVNFPVDVRQAGVAEDGYIVGGTVSYANGSDNGATATTDARGGFTLTGGTGPLILTGGVDSATGLPFTGGLEAPNGSTALTPLTTLVEKVAQAMGDDTSAAGIAAADASVVAALGLPSGTDLTTLDAVAGTLNGVAGAEPVFAAGSQLLDTLTLVDAAGGSGDAALDAIAAKLAAGQTVDLSGPAAVIAAAGLSPAAAAAVTDMADATNAAVATQLAAASDPLAIFNAITGGSIALQGNAATALETAARPGSNETFASVDTSFTANLGAILAADDRTAARNDTAPCYCQGTLILTNHGEIAVENLAIGDFVSTMHGGFRPIKWIGRRSYDGRFIAGQPLMLPICVKQGAIDENVPARDLWVSPGHAICIDDALVPAWLLVNSVSITQAESVESLTYIHVELADHEVIFADGCPAESFFDDDCRGQFQNGSEFSALYPDNEKGPGGLCLPRLEEGFRLQAIQRRLAACADAELPAGRFGPLRGYVDRAGPDVVAGWAQNEKHPEAPMRLDIIVEGRRVMCALANRYRADLRAAGPGSGKHSFEVPLPAGVSGRVEVRRSTDQALLALAEARDSSSDYPGRLRGEVDHRVVDLQPYDATRSDVETLSAESGPLRGFIDLAGPRIVAGWARDEAHPETPVNLEILVGGERVTGVIANRYRADLREAGLCGGNHAFEVELHNGVFGWVEVRRSSDRAILALTEAARAWRLGDRDFALRSPKEKRRVEVTSDLVG